jgi:hypothetical protein
MTTTPKLMALPGLPDNQYRDNRSEIFNTNKGSWVRLNVYWNTIQGDTSPTGSITATWDAMRNHPELARLDDEIKAINDEHWNGKDIGVILTIANSYPRWTNGTVANEVDPLNSNRLAKDRFPISCTADSPYGWFLSNLTARYLGYWNSGVGWYTGFTTPGGPDWRGAYLGNNRGAWINLIEVANEPNTACWPQDGDTAACRVNEMMRTADYYVSGYGGFASCGPGMTDWPWPGSADTKVYKDIEMFTNQLTSKLMGWTPSRPIYWTLHNYTDISLEQTTRFDRIAGYVDQQWYWPGTPILITEGGYAIPLNQFNSYANGPGEAVQNTKMSLGYQRFGQRSRAWTYPQWQVNNGQYPPDNFQSALRLKFPPPDTGFRPRPSLSTWKTM